MMKYNWVTTLANKEYHINIKEKEERVISWETTGHWRSETGGYVSFKDFLNGDWDSWIIKIYGKNILGEIKETVQFLEAKP